MADDMELRQELKKMREKLRKQARMHETLMVEYAKHDESAVEELQAVTLELEALKEGHAQTLSLLKEEKRKRVAAEENQDAAALENQQVQELCDEISCLKDSMRRSEIDKREMCADLDQTRSALSAAEVDSAEAGQLARTAAHDLHLLRLQVEQAMMHIEEQEQKRVESMRTVAALEALNVTQVAERQACERRSASQEAAIEKLQKENGALLAELCHAQEMLAEQQQEFKISKRRSAHLVKDLKEQLKKEAKVREKAERDARGPQAPQQRSQGPVSRHLMEEEEEEEEEEEGIKDRSDDELRSSERGEVSVKRSAAKRKDHVLALPRSEAERSLCTELGARLGVRNAVNRLIHEPNIIF